MDQVRMINRKTEEQRATWFHEQSVTDAADIWRDGLNVLLRAFDPVSGRKVDRDEGIVLIALLLRALQTVSCANDLALRGYYPQALNLLRTPIEDWMSYWYLRSFPQEHSRFTNFAEATPLFNDMLQRIEAKHQRPDPNVRAWIKRLHQFSHIDRSGVRMVILLGEEGISLALGPQQDELLFRYCTSEALAVIVALLEAVDNLRRLVGCDSLVGMVEYGKRVQKWQKALKELVSS